MSITRSIRIARTALALAVGSLAAAEPTTITITDRVLVKDTERLGVHFSGDNFYDSVILKRRVAENFEGRILRLHVMGDNDQSDPDGIFTWGEGDYDDWIGATVHVLGGPNQSETRKVTGAEIRDFAFGGRDVRSTSFIRFDRPVVWTKEGYVAGVLLEKTDLGAGQHPWLDTVRKNVDGQRVTSLELNRQYASPDRTEVVTGDVAEDSPGVAAMRLDGTGGDAYLKFRVQFYNAAPYDGVWTVKFRAKISDGSPELVVGPTVPGTSFQPVLTDQWRRFTEKLTLEKPEDPEKNPIFMLNFGVTGGVVLLDDVELSKDGDGENPTPFRDELIDVFHDLKPGSVRYLRNVKDSYLNSVLPRTRNYSRGMRGRDRDDFGTHEFYQFCEHIGANPWATLPGTMLLDEMDQVMEYHGAPADVGLGKLRAELGQVEPWTNVFDKIYIQFGNEAITFGGTGYWGPGYWQSLIDRAKSSPYYDPDVIVFVLNEQGCGTRGMDMHPGFDRFTINGYHIFGVYSDQVKRAGDLEGYYDWVFASAWHNWMVPQHNKNAGNLKGAKERGKEIAIYEGGNYHTTFCDPEDVDVDRINKMVVGRAGGMSATHTMLILLKHWGARTQQSFNLSQFSFSPGGAFGNIPGRVRVWGGVLGIGDPARRRYRPRFLALKMANEVLGGDLVETVHTGADPKFSVTNRFGAGYGPSRNPVEMTVADIPRIHSYAFREGRRTGLILVSNDPRETRPVVLEFDGTPDEGSARMWVLESPELESTNEPDWAPDAPAVTVEESRPADFASGHRLDLPPATMVVLEWESGE